jgi:3-hydroxybutyryl-CoA dehydrogenase
LAAKRKKASTPTSNKPSFSPEGKIICLFGESPLVEEYAVRCKSKGFEVHARVNKGETVKGGTPGTGSLLPKGVRTVTRPSPATYLAIELTNTSPDDKRKNLQDLARSLHSRIPILTSSVTVTVAEQTGWIQSPSSLIGIGAFPTFLEGSLIEFATSPLSDEACVRVAGEFASALEKEAVFVQDSIGLVLPRIVCMLANEACFAAMEGVAVGKDIDTAMKLGTNYPNGPFEWTERIGVRQIHAALQAMTRSYGEDRYRVAPLLHRAAFLNALPTK